MIIIQQALQVLIVFPLRIAQLGFKSEPPDLSASRLHNDQTRPPMLTLDHPYRSAIESRDSYTNSASKRVRQ